MNGHNDDEFRSAFAPVVAELAKVMAELAKAFREAARAIFFALRTVFRFLLPSPATVRQVRELK